MLSKSILPFAFAGAAIAMTPPGFQPDSKQELIVAFGNTLALNGKSMTKADTAQVPIIGTTQRLTGSYTLMMVDPDIPPQKVGGPTGQLLHWMQQGFTSANTATMIGGMMVFVLSSDSNMPAFAPYFGPSPPDKAPNTHRYTQLLLDTTGANSSSALGLLKQAAMTRLNFNADQVVKAARVKIVGGNSFNVTNGTTVATTATSGSSMNSAGLVSSNITKLNPNTQHPGTGAPSGGANMPAVNSNGKSGASANGTSAASPARNGTSGTSANGTNGASPATNGSAETGPAVPAPKSGCGQRGGGAYIAGLLALAAGLFLL